MVWEAAVPCHPGMTGGCCPAGGWSAAAEPRGGAARPHVGRLHISPALTRHVYRGRQPLVRKGEK